MCHSFMTHLFLFFIFLIHRITQSSRNILAPSDYSLIFTELDLAVVAIPPKAGTLRLYKRLHKPIPIGIKSPTDFTDFTDLFGASKRIV